MDVAYNQHADRARRQNRSSTNIQHLSLAPLTAKLPLNDDDLIPDSVISPVLPAVSYLQGKSAPTTPRLLARSPTSIRSRSQHRAAPVSLAKSKSASHLASPDVRRTLSGRTTPSRKAAHRDDGLSMRHRNDSDWLLRTGAFMSSETRESKGQAWLVSRQSSTSLSGMKDDEDDDFVEMQLARERDLAYSRRGSSLVPDAEDASPYGSRFASRNHSRVHSRTHSRSHSLSRNRSQMVLSPLAVEEEDSYFVENHIDGPDFVNLDERLEELERDTIQDDEVLVRRLVRRGQAGAETWFGTVWSLFSVDETVELSEDSDPEDSSCTETASQNTRSRSMSSRNLAGLTAVPEERVPPPGADDSGWKDAAWLLSVASKVMF